MPKKTYICEQCGDRQVVPLPPRACKKCNGKMVEQPSLKPDSLPSNASDKESSFTHPITSSIATNPSKGTDKVGTEIDRKPRTGPTAPSVDSPGYQPRSRKLDSPTSAWPAGLDSNDVLEQAVSWTYRPLIDAASVPCRFSPVIDKNYRLLACCGNELICLEWNSTEPVVSWKQQFRSRIASQPCYLKSGYIVVHCISGSIEILTETGKSLNSLPQQAPLENANPIAWDDTRCLIFNWNGGITIIDVEQQQAKSFDQMPVFDSTPITFDRTLVTGGHQRLYRIEEIRDSVFDVETLVRTDGLFLGRPLLVENHVLANTQSGRVIGCKMNAGHAAKWESGPFGRFLTSMVESNKIAYAVATIGERQSHLLALDSTNGDVIFSKTIDGRVESTPVISSAQTIYIGTCSGKLHAYDIQEQQLVWSSELASSIVSPLTIWAKHVVFGTRCGTLVGVRIQEESPAEGMSSFNLGRLNLHSSNNTEL